MESGCIAHSIVKFELNVLWRVNSAQPLTWPVRFTMTWVLIRLLHGISIAAQVTLTV